MGFFKKNNQNADDNPYLNARRTWNEHEGSLLSAKRSWQVVALICLIVTLGSVGGIIHIGAQSKFIPYIVQVDRLGQAAAVAPADRASPVDSRVIHASIASFITDARLVTPDVTVQRNAIFRVYSVLQAKDPATLKITEWFNGNAEANPFKRSAKEVVNIEISSVIQQSQETWQVDWREYTRTREGVLKSAANMRALVTVYISSPTENTTMDQLRQNPIGMYVRDFSWSKQL